MSKDSTTLLTRPAHVGGDHHTGAHGDSGGAGVASGAGGGGGGGRALGAFAAGVRRGVARRRPRPGRAGAGASTASATRCATSTTSAPPGRASSASRSSTCGWPPTPLRRETAALSTALRKPQVRGRWGEMHLQRAAELTGMVDRCDFDLQTTVRDGGAALRPDMVVHLAGDKQVVVDSGPAAGRVPRRDRGRGRRRAGGAPRAARAGSCGPTSTARLEGLLAGAADDAGVRGAVRAC